LFRSTKHILKRRKQLISFPLMRCLSLKQPFAELLVSGKKTIELRKWNTKFRGKFLIHASKQVDKERASSLNIDHTKLSKGAIIGTAELYYVKEYKSNAEFVKDKNKHYTDIKKFGSKYGFMVRNAIDSGLQSHILEG
jgi:hypothetical protein